jgi:hypothetical protein
MDVFGMAVPVTGRYLKPTANFGGKSFLEINGGIDWSTGN